MTAGGAALAQTTSKDAMTGSTSGKIMDFIKMDANSDGWVTREDYLGFYGTRYDSMKRNDKGMVSWSDMERSDGGFFKPGTTSNTTNNPVTSNPGTKSGTAINPPPAAAPSNSNR